MKLKAHYKASEVSGLIEDPSVKEWMVAKIRDCLRGDYPDELIDSCEFGVFVESYRDPYAKGAEAHKIVWRVWHKSHEGHTRKRLVILKDTGDVNLRSLRKVAEDCIRKHIDMLSRKASNREAEALMEDLHGASPYEWGMAIKNGHLVLSRPPSLRGVEFSVEHAAEVRQEMERLRGLIEKWTSERAA